MNGSSVRSSRSGVTEMRLFATAAMSVPSRGFGRSLRAKVEPVIRIAAPVVARIDAQQILIALALHRDGDALHVIRARNPGKFTFTSTPSGMPSFKTLRITSGPWRSAVSQNGLPRVSSP